MQNSILIVSGLLGLVSTVVGFASLVKNFVEEEEEEEEEHMTTTTSFTTTNAKAKAKTPSGRDGW